MPVATRARVPASPSQSTTEGRTARGSSNSEALLASVSPTVHARPARRLPAGDTRKHPGRLCHHGAGRGYPGSSALLTDLLTTPIKWVPIWGHRELVRHPVKHGSTWRDPSSAIGSHWAVPDWQSRGSWVQVPSPPPHSRRSAFSPSSKAAHRLRRVATFADSGLI
jgi:hypothetical protein